MCAFMCSFKIFRAANIIVDAIKPHSVENGGSLTYEFIAYDKDKERANLIIGYIPPGYVEKNGTISFIGSHFDVVPANPDEWQRNPFKLTIEVKNYSILHGVNDLCLSVCFSAGR